jgi:hypothetical protein
MDNKKLKKLQTLKSITLKEKKAAAARKREIENKISLGINALKKAIIEAKGEQKKELKKCLKLAMDESRKFQERTIETKALFKKTLSSIQKDINLLSKNR